MVPSEGEWLEDANVEFLLQLESAYSKNFELPFLKGSDQLGVVESNVYETWYEGYMQLIRRWLVNPIEFFPQFPSLSNLHQQWVTLYIECLHSVFQKYKLCIRAPTRINPTNRFGETMFRYTRARLQQQERTRGFLMEAYIRVRLTHFKDRLYGHYKEHALYFRELARTMDGDPELSYKEYTDLKAQLLLEKRQEEECKQRVEHREGTVLSGLHRCNLVSDPNANKLTVEVLKEAIRKIKSSSTWQYAALRVGGNRPHLLDQVEAVLPAYEAQDWSFVYKP